MPFALRDNSIGLHYQRVGNPQGEPILLIQGYSLPGALYASSAEELADEFEVIWFDNRGTGLSDTPDGGYTIMEMAKDAFAVMDAAEWQSAHILGASMGGMIAQEMALMYPERVRSLALIASYAGYPPRKSEEFAHIIELAHRLEQQAYIQPDNPEQAVRIMWDIVAPEGSFGNREEMIQQIAALLRTMPSRRVPKAEELLEYYSLDRLHQLTMPVHIRHGKNDPIMPVEGAFLMAQQIQQCELHIISPGMHAINLALGDRSTVILKNWWKSLRNNKEITT